MNGDILSIITDYIILSKDNVNKQIEDKIVWNFFINTIFYQSYKSEFNISYLYMAGGEFIRNFSRATAYTNDNVALIPKRLFYSSGMNRKKGYKNYT